MIPPPCARLTAGARWRYREAKVGTCEESGPRDAREDFGPMPGWKGGESYGVDDTRFRGVRDRGRGHRVRISLVGVGVTPDTLLEFHAGTYACRRGSC